MSNSDLPKKLNAPAGRARARLKVESRSVFRDTFWFILKNVVGWMLILASPVLGVTVPGPGGIPVFLIGFALVTLPGKRKLTSRVMRGRGLRVGEGPFTFFCALISVGLTIALIFVALHYWKKETFNQYRESFDAYLPVAFAGIVAFTLISFITTWIVTSAGIWVANWIIRKIPWIRRKIKPWLRRKGINLLPTRRKRQDDGSAEKIETDEIVEFHEDYVKFPQRAWTFLAPWLRRMMTVGITILIFVMMIKPLKDKWEVTREQLSQMSLLRFLFAGVMFAFFLLIFRAVVWRRILKAFGYALPYPAAVRIWSTSELARYLPGSIWQVIGRVMLVKPYGVSGSVCSTTQILELCIFLLANVLLASACWLYYGAKEMTAARGWFFAAMGLVPLLSLILHPRVFYTIVNWILVRLKKPAIVTRLRGKHLVLILLWTILGLVFQSLAVFLIAQEPLNLKIDWLWIIAGAYSLAWCAGFLAFWAPGGIGVRELVFVAAMGVMLPDSVRMQLPFSDPIACTSVLVGLGLILRLWTILGELILTSLSYVFDYQGAMRMMGTGPTTARSQISELTS